MKLQKLLEDHNSDKYNCLKTKIQNIIKNTEKIALSSSPFGDFQEGAASAYKQIIKTLKQAIKECE
jgi:hypothetical protein